MTLNAKISIGMHDCCAISIARQSSKHAHFYVTSKQSLQRHLSTSFDVYFTVAFRYKLEEGWSAASFSENLQRYHLSGKPGDVREFETCQRNVREKILSWKSFPKLFITSWIFAFNSIFFLLADLYSHTCKFCGASKPLLFAFIV